MIMKPRSVFISLKIIEILSVIMY